MNIKFDRILIEDDLPNIMKWVNDPEIKQYFASFQNYISNKEEKEFILSLIENEDKKYPLSVTRSILIDGEYAGQIAINKIFWPAKNGQLFMVLTKKFRGKGLAKDVLRKFLFQVKHEILLHKVYLIVRADNKKAQALYLKVGFDFEGVLKEEYCVPGGGYCDMVRMGILLPALSEGA